MTKTKYQLKCHKQEKTDTKIYATIELQRNRLKVKYEITGNLSQYNFPKESKQKRANELWRDTCFELFIANRLSTEYYEINIAPSTEWNVYRFTSYKEEMRESDVFSTPFIEIYQSNKRYNFSFNISLKENILKKELFINLAVILLGKEGVRHFYSINRRDIYPDFHDRDYFESF